jgi:CubicO group peptidase (beta-lactamase class C family)
LDWNTTMAEAFPELAEKFHPDMRTVTLHQLLSHRSGLPPNLSLLRYQGQDVRALRRRAVKEYLANAPSHPPGSNYEYSNLGYIIAGAVVEEVLDQTWENTIRKELFEPLGMTTAGFGGTGTPGEIDQPWPHDKQGNPMPKNGPATDNPPVMGPAGRVHCSIQDWAKFVQDQLRGARGATNALLQPTSYTQLHTPPADAGYALGWRVTERDWGGGTVLQHSGDNTMNHANVWIAPKRDFAILVCVNQGGDTAFRASDAAVGAMIKLWENKQRAAAGAP